MKERAKARGSLAGREALLEISESLRGIRQAETASDWAKVGALADEVSDQLRAVAQQASWPVADVDDSDGLLTTLKDDELSEAIDKCEAGLVLLQRAGMSGTAFVAGLYADAIIKQMQAIKVGLGERGLLDPETVVTI